MSRKTFGFWRLNGYIGGTEISLLELARFLYQQQQEVWVYGPAGALAERLLAMEIGAVPEADIFKHRHDVLLWYDVSKNIRAELPEYFDLMAAIPRRIGILGGYQPFNVSDEMCTEVLAKGTGLVAYANEHWDLPVTVAQCPIGLDLWRPSHLPPVVDPDLYVPVFGYVGRTERKNLSELVDIAWAAGARTRMVVSDRWANAELTAYQQRGVEVVRNSGWPLPEFQALDVFGMTSLREGVPRCIMEAMACALPTIIWDVGSIADLDPQYLLPPHSTPEAARLLRNLMADADLRAVVGKRNRETIGRYDARMRRILAEYLGAWPQRIDLGCGKSKLPGFYGYDRGPDSQADVVCDLAKGIPQPDNTVDEVNCSHALEHFEHPEKLVAEIVRVGNPGATVRIRVPLRVTDPAHPVVLDDDWITKYMAGLTVEKYETGPITTTSTLSRNFGEAFTYTEARGVFRVP